MFEVILGHFNKGIITLPTGEKINASPYSNILSKITNTKGFYLVSPFSNNSNAYAIKNYVLVEDELYAKLTEN